MRPRVVENAVRLQDGDRGPRGGLAVGHVGGGLLRPATTRRRRRPGVSRTTPPSRDAGLFAGLAWPRGSVPVAFTQGTNPRCPARHWSSVHTVVCGPSLESSGGGRGGRWLWLLSSGLVERWRCWPSAASVRAASSRDAETKPRARNSACLLASFSALTATRQASSTRRAAKAICVCAKAACAC